ncbi:hypothetical protein HDU67_006143, partial [Dinochytrium kinnereticum]
MKLKVLTASFAVAWLAPFVYGMISERDVLIPPIEKDKFCVGISLFHAVWNVQQALPIFSDSLLPFGVIPYFDEEADGLMYANSIAYGAQDFFDVVDYIEAIIIEGVESIPQGEFAIARIKAAVRLIGEVVACEAQVNRQRYATEFVQRMLNAYGTRFQEEDKMIDLTASYDTLPTNEDFADETLYFDLKAFPILLNAVTTPDAYKAVMVGPYQEILSVILDLMILQSSSEEIQIRRRQRRQGGADTPPATLGQNAVANLVLPAATGPDPAASVGRVVEVLSRTYPSIDPSFWP